MFVNIVPRIIPVQALNFTVKEGLSRVINADIINILDPFYNSSTIDISVDEPPKHGDIRSLSGQELSYFSLEEVSRQSTSLMSSSALCMSFLMFIICSTCVHQWYTSINCYYLPEMSNLPASWGTSTCRKKNHYCSHSESGFWSSIKNLTFVVALQIGRKKQCKLFIYQMAACTKWLAYVQHMWCQVAQNIWFSV